jgi:hypothetical protein
MVVLVYHHCIESYSFGWRFTVVGVDDFGHEGCVIAKKYFETGPKKYFEVANFVAGSKNFVASFYFFWFLVSTEHGQ